MIGDSLGRQKHGNEYMVHSSRYELHMHSLMHIMDTLQVPMQEKHWQLPRPRVIANRAPVPSYRTTGGMFTGGQFRGVYSRNNFNSMPPRPGPYIKYPAPPPPLQTTTFPRSQEHSRQQSNVPPAPPPPPLPPNLANPHSLQGQIRQLSDVQMR